MEIDPREVLAHLNRLGYKNITATQLKDFIIDLKKLIKYEARISKCRKDNKGERNYVQECMKSMTAGAIKNQQQVISNDYDPFQRQKVTVTVRTVDTDEEIKKEERNLRENVSKDKREVVKIKDPEPQKKVSRGVSTVPIKENEKKVETKINEKPEFDTRPAPEGYFADILKENVSRPCSRSSKGSAGTKTYTIDDDTSEKRQERVKMWIRTSRPKSLTHKTDPVELYHKYKKQWDKYKQYIPGENDHSDLRWQIRTKLLS